MSLLRFSNPVLYYHLILFISFCVSINYLIDLKYLNLSFYLLFHITMIYLTFYYYHYSLYFFIFIYGILFDIFFLNNIGSHLIAFIIFLILISQTKRFLFDFNANKIIFIILFCVIFIIFLEMSFASVIYNYNFNLYKFFELIILSIIIIFPTIITFLKFDKL